MDLYDTVEGKNTVIFNRDLGQLEKVVNTPGTSYNFGLKFRQNDDMFISNSVDLFANVPEKRRRKTGSGKGGYPDMAKYGSYFRPFCSICNKRPYISDQRLDNIIAFKTNCRMATGCQLCHMKAFLSKRDTQMHYFSKKHLYNMQMQWNRVCEHASNENPVLYSPNSCLVNRAKRNSSFSACQLCGVTLNSHKDYLQHMSGKRHHRNVQRLRPNVPINN